MKMHIRKIRSSVCLAATAAAFLLAGSLGSVSTAQAESTLERLQKQGFARIAIANEPPWTEVQASGKVTGAAPEIARAVLKKLGVNEIIASVSEYGAMIPGLQAGRFDLVAAGLYIKPKRCAAIKFSEPDLCDAEAFMVKKGNPLGLTTYEGVAQSTAKLGGPGGGTELQLAKDAGVPDDRRITVPDTQSGVKMLQDGRIDVYALPTLSLNAALAKAGDSNLEIMSPVEGVKVYCAGAGFNKADAEFRDAYDKALLELKESGEYAAILAKFGFPATAAAKTSRKLLCEGDN